MSFAWTKVMQTKIWLLNGKRLVVWITCRNALFRCSVSSANCSRFSSPLCCSLHFGWHNCVPVSIDYKHLFFNHPHHQTTGIKWKNSKSS
jgi:hypothetical protein